VLTSGITNIQTTINVVAVTGFPASVPYILALDYNTPSEEIVLVTAQAGTTLTVTRAYDGTSGTSHNSGAGVRHTWTAKDGNDSRAHEGSTQGVHGLGALSSVVGTTDTQTLTNKTLVSPSITSATLNGATLNSPSITGTVSGLAIYQTPTFSADVDADASAINKRRSATQTGALVSYQNELGSDLANVGSDGIPHWKQGLQVGSTNQFQVNTSGALTTTGTVSGASYIATSMASAYSETMTASGVLTNTSYASTTPTVTASVTCPPSGKVYISGTIRQEANAGHFTFSALNVTGSTSGTIKAPNDGLAVLCGTTSSYIQMGGGVSFEVSGTPGETITAQWQHKTDGAGGNYTIYAKSISLLPMIG
jgi:hypothetical protein